MQGRIGGFGVPGQASTVPCGLEPLPCPSLPAVIDDNHVEVLPGLPHQRPDAVGQLRIGSQRWNRNSYQLLRQDLILTRGCSGGTNVMGSSIRSAREVEEDTSKETCVWFLRESLAKSLLFTPTRVGPEDPWRWRMWPAYSPGVVSRIAAF